MELTHLRAFVSVARTGQLVRSAEQLHLTQSAVSKQIRSLEDLLAVPLFDRLPGGMALTAVGRSLLPLALKTVEAAADLSAAAIAARGAVAGTLRLGTIIDPESIRLGPLLSGLVELYPHLDVSLHHGMSGGVLQQLLDEAVDACFHLGEVHDARVVARHLSTEHYVILAPRAWEPRLRDASWADLAALPWLAARPGSSQHGLAARLFASHGLEPRTVVEVDQEASMIELIQSGVAMGLMRERLAASALAQGQVVTWSDTRMPCPLSLLSLRSHADSPALRALSTTLSRVWPFDA